MTKEFENFIGTRYGSMQDWTSDSLWAKSKIYCDFAFDSEPDSPLFPLLASVALELLGKAALARIHPVLIADPRGEGTNVLYAFGVPTKSPHTIVAKSVFTRLTQLVPEFSQEDEEACLLMAERRNRELHSGVLAYEGVSSSQWLDDFYRVAKVLCDFVGKDVTDLLGSTRGTEAKEVSSETRKKAEANVRKAISEAQRRFAAMGEPERKERDKVSAYSSWHNVAGQTAKMVGCPACERRALLMVRLVAERPAEIDGDTIYQTDVLSPRALRCPICELELHGTAELKVVGLADLVTRTYESSPIEFFDIRPDQVIDPYDYGND